MNLQIIRNKLDLVQCFVLKEDCDIFSFLFHLNVYAAVHSCRAGRGGGVTISARYSIKFREIEKSDKDKSINWIAISLVQQN